MKVLFITALITATLWAHFQVILPSKSIIEDQKDATITLHYEFTHPFEQTLMNMVKPQEAAVFVEGSSHSLLTTLTHKNSQGLSMWESTFTCKQPAVYQFYVDPVPYFEASEGKFIRHQTKVIIDAYGAGEGWDKPIGLKAEIIPLTRPYGLYQGNIFSAKVLYKGKIAPHTQVEVELYNTHGYKAPSEAHITQVVTTDDNGIFHFVMPKSGWWGFAALIDDDMTITREKKTYPVELGALLWIYANEMH